MWLPESTRPELWTYELPCPHSDTIWPDEHLIEHRGRRYCILYEDTDIYIHTCGDGPYNQGIIRFRPAALLRIADAVGATDEAAVVGVEDSGTIQTAAEYIQQRRQVAAAERTYLRPHRTNQWRDATERARQAAEALREAGDGNSIAALDAKAAGADIEPTWMAALKSALEWWDEQTEENTQTTELLGW